VRNPQELEFQPSPRRRVEAAFDAGRMSSDGGLLLLREASLRLSLFERFGACFRDHRQGPRVEHTVPELLSQRVLAIACGYEDLNDHDRLRDDALLALAVGKSDPLGVTRPRARDAGRALASSATLNRLERTPGVLDGTRPDWKITHDPAAIESLFVEVFLDAHATPPEEIVLDLDATDDAVHGDQEGRFFHGYYDKYCFLPLYIFSGEHLLTALLRPSNIDGAAGALEEVQRIVEQVRQRWPDTRIILRADSGFARQPLMTWCEATEGVDYVIGLSRNSRLERMVSQELDAMVALEKRSGHPERCYKELRFQTLQSWNRERRVVAKAEATGGKKNPRFVVTSLSIERLSTKALYADFYCARGDMENRIKARPSYPTRPWVLASHRLARHDSSWGCSQTAPAPTRCERTSFGSGSHRWPTCCCTMSAGSAFEEPLGPGSRFGICGRGC